MDDVLGAALTEPVEVPAEAPTVAADLLETQESGIQLSP